MNNYTDKLISTIFQFQESNYVKPSIIYCSVLFFDKLIQEINNQINIYLSETMTFFGVPIEPLNGLINDNLIVLNKDEYESIIYVKNHCNAYNNHVHKLQFHIRFSEAKCTSPIPMDVKLFILEFDNYYFDNKHDWKLSNINISYL